VQIECLPYEEVLDRYDRPTSLFYLDPPYYDIKLYHYNLEPEEFRTMAERLGKLKAKFILSLNDVPEVHALFKNFTIKTVELAYTAQKIAGRRYREMLITNF
jgi:DNA adenine methylase